MVIRKSVMALCLGAAILTSACSGGEKKSSAVDTEGDAATTGSVQSTAAVPPTRTPVLSVDAAQKPCSVLTDSELKTATGGAPLTSDALPDRVQPICRWYLDIEGQPWPAVFELVASSLGNTSLFNASGAGAQAVTGIGDEAYAVPATGSSQAAGLTLWVRQGGKVLRIYLAPLDAKTLTTEAGRKAFNDRALVVATALAKSALPRL